MSRIAIIGGGAAGAAVVGEFLRRADARVGELVWVVGERAPGRGVAYHTLDEAHLLNVRAANMGLFADAPHAFVDYLHARGLAIDASDFVPRSRYGDYLETTIADLIERSRLRVRIRSSEAIALRPAGHGGFVIETRDGSIERADGAVLAVGALPPASPAHVTPTALASGAYVTNAWRVPTLEREPDDVLVIGSGLTAVDVLLSSAARWPRARLTAISRHGLLPRPHAAPNMPAYVRGGELVTAIDARADLRHWLRMLRAAADADGVDWRAVLDALRPHTAALWRALDMRQRRRFQRHLQTRWEVCRHRLPPQTLAKIERLRASGRLRVLAARVRRIDGGAIANDMTGGVEAASPDRRLHVTMQSRGSANALTISADCVIQATGFQTDVRSGGALLRQLLDDRVVDADALDLGFAARADGCLVAPDGRVWPNLRALGTLLRGTPSGNARACPRSVSPRASSRANFRPCSPTPALLRPTHGRRQLMRRAHERITTLPFCREWRLPRMFSHVDA